MEGGGGSSDDLIANYALETGGNLAAIATSLALLDDVVQAEDAAHASGDKGIMALAVRRDAGGAVAADGDYLPLTVDSNGKLWATVVGTVTASQGGSWSVDAAVSGDVGLTGDALTSLELIDDAIHAEDAVHNSGDKGIQALAVRKDTATALAADGDYLPLIVDSSGRLHVNVGAFTGTVTADTELPAAAALADATANPTAPAVGAFGHIWDSAASAWHREVANTEGTALSSAARSATTSSSDLQNNGHRGVIVWLDVTSNPGAQTLTVLIQGKDSGGNYYTLNGAGTAIAAANAKLGIELYPGASTAPGGSGQNRIIERTAASLPKSWRVQVVHSGGSSWTYSAYYSLIR